METRGDDTGGQSSDLEQRFFDLSLDMLAVLGFDGHFKRLNHAWESTLGFTPAEMMARPFIDFVHPDDRERTLSQNKDVRGGGRARLFENRYVCKDGTYKWMLWNARPDPDRQMIYAVARDMTARKLADEEREKLVRELQEALAEVRVLQSFLPICSYCKRIRNDQNYWQSVEGYISAHTNTQFSHSICPACFETRVDPAFKEGL